MTRVFNRTSKKATRRKLRTEMPQAEVLMWARLRDRQVDGLKFRRQYSVGPYVVDFYCPAARLALEIDGDTHFGDGAEKRDARRQRFIKAYGIRFIRCTNEDVYHNIEGVLEEVVRVACSKTDRGDPPQSPLVKGGSNNSPSGSLVKGRS